MERVAPSIYGKFIKGVVLVGIPFFFTMGAMALWLATDEYPNMESIVIYGAMAAGLSGMGLFGSRLLPFIHCSCQATPEGLHVVDWQLNEIFYPWTAISHFKDWQTLQILDIYAKDGRRVLSVDYYISNFQQFHHQVVESVGGNA